MPLLRQILNVQREFRSSHCRASLRKKTSTIQNYILNVKEFSFPAAVSGKYVFALPLMASHNRETDFITLIFSLEDSSWKLWQRRCKVVWSRICCCYGNSRKGIEASQAQSLILRCWRSSSSLPSFLLHAYARQQAPVGEDWYRGLPRVRPVPCQRL